VHAHPLPVDGKPLRGSASRPSKAEFVRIEERAVGGSGSPGTCAGRGFLGFSFGNHTFRGIVESVVGGLQSPESIWPSVDFCLRLNRKSAWYTGFPLWMKGFPPHTIPKLQKAWFSNSGPAPAALASGLRKPKSQNPSSCL